MFQNVLAAVERNDFPAAAHALACESQLNEMQREFRWTHVRRLGEGACSPIAGLIFVDFVDNMAKIGDHLTNVAPGVLGGLQWNGKDARAAAPAGQAAEA
jgi:phosphate:Na+ symporter